MCTNAWSRLASAIHRLPLVLCASNQLFYSKCCPSRRNCDCLYRRGQRRGFSVEAAKILDANRNGGCDEDGDQDGDAVAMGRDGDAIHRGQNRANDGCHDGYRDECRDDDDPSVTGDALNYDVTATPIPIFPDRIR